MKKIFFLSLVLFQSMSIFAQDSNYDAVYNKLTKIYTLNADGSMDYSYSKELKLQTYRAFHNLYGETFIVYNPAFQTLKVNNVQTIMADGKKVKAPANAFNEVLPGFAANAPAYNGLREMVVTHPATERNAVLFIDYDIHSQKNIFPALSGMEILSETEPVKDLTLKVRVPQGTKLNYKVINSEIKPVIAHEGGLDIYTWNLRDVPAIATEENQKGFNESYPRIIFSTATDRRSFYDAVNNQDAFSFVADAGMKKMVSSILEGNKEPYDVILKIQDKVNDLKTWPVPLQYTGYKVRTASETFKSNGGTPVEKAVLMTALLREAGIEAYVAGVVKESNYDEATGLMQDIEDFIVLAKPEKLEVLYLSPVRIHAQNLNYGMPGKVITILKPYTTPEKMKEYAGKISLKSRFVMNDKKQLDGEIFCTFTNNFDPWFTQLRDEVKMKNFFTGGISSGDLKELKVITTGPVEGYVRYSALKEKPFRKDSNYYYYTLPAVSSGIDSWGIKLLTKKRLTSYEIPSEAEESYEFVLDAAGMKLFSAGNNASIKNSCGSFEYDVKQDGTKLTVKKSIVLKKRIITPEEYAGFKELMDRWNSNGTREIILTQK